MERHVYDENQPYGMMSLLNLRNALRGLFQGDLMPLRARASSILDAMEYGTDAAAQAAWAGTGLTVTKSTTHQEGDYSIQAVVDVTGNRDLQQSKVLDLSGFKQITLWHRVNATAQSLRFYVEDGSGNRSYWNLTTHASANTWKQDTITLATPDGNNGTDATLSSITKFGYYQLPASKTFLFDTIKAICGLNVAIEGAQIGSFYRNVYLGLNNMTFTGGPSPNITPPVSNPRIDLLCLNSSGALVWVTGTEASSPAEPAFPTDKVPICLIYCKGTMARVVDYEDKDANPNEAYIYRDVRPLFCVPQLI